MYLFYGDIQLYIKEEGEKNGLERIRSSIQFT